MGSYHLPIRTQVHQDSPEFDFDANSRDITSKTVLDLGRLALVLGRRALRMNNRHAGPMHEQPSTDICMEQPSSLNDESSTVPQWHGVPLISLPLDKEDDRWTPCTVELTDDDNHVRSYTTKHLQPTSMSVDQPQTAEQVETGTVTATYTNPTQQIGDSHETVVSVRQCVEQDQAEIPTITPCFQYAPFRTFNSRTHGYFCGTEQCSSSACYSVCHTDSLLVNVLHRKSKPVGPKRCGTEPSTEIQAQNATTETEV